MLDIGTGGGEWRSSLRARAPVTVATDSWAPNVPVAPETLLELAIPLVLDDGAADNARQDLEDPRGRLAFKVVA
jgi:hypothetical protein